MKKAELTEKNKQLRQKIDDVQTEIETVESLIVEHQQKIAYFNGSIKASQEILKKLKKVIETQQV